MGSGLKVTEDVDIGGRKNIGDIMVSRLTAWTIQYNEVEVIETSERCECWLIKDGRPHALLLSCPLDKRADMDDAIRQFKSLDTLAK